MATSWSHQAPAGADDRTRKEHMIIGAGAAPNSTVMIQAKWDEAASTWNYTAWPKGEVAAGNTGSGTS